MEEAGLDVMIVELDNAKGTSKQSAVWLHFEDRRKQWNSEPGPAHGHL